MKRVAFITGANRGIGFETAKKLAEKDIKVIRTPRHARIFSPVVHAIPVQLLAYHVALIKKTDVDKPRNLAKSVTVE